MKVQFSIQKGRETEKTGMFSTKEVDKYELIATFTPSEKEKKIYNDHPLFKDMIFMEYNEVDKFHASFLGAVTGVGKETVVDNTKWILVKNIYDSPSYKFRAYSVGRICELRNLVLEAGKTFADNVKILEELEGENEVEFKPSEN